MLLSRHLSHPGLLAALLPLLAFAQRSTSQEALQRLEETVEMRVQDGVFTAHDVTPAIVVSVMPAFEETRAWYPTAALSSLARAFGASGLRACEACMSPRLYVNEGRMEQNLTSLSHEEIIRLDENTRGKAPPARTAIFLDETYGGVSLRIIDLRNGRILLAENFDPQMAEAARTRRNFTLTRELERRMRGESITHTMLDLALYPGQHVSMDFLEQWGDTNHNLTGLSVSFWDPAAGVGLSYFRVVPQALDISVGGKLMLSVPTAIVSGVNGEVTEVIDPLVTAVFMVRVPIASSNYAVIASASTQGRVGVGISLMNLSFLPVLP